MPLDDKDEFDRFEYVGSDEFTWKNYIDNGLPLALVSINGGQYYAFYYFPDYVWGAFAPRWKSIDEDETPTGYEFAEFMSEL